MQTKPANSFLLLVIFLLLLSACGGGTTLPATSPTSIALPTPTNVPVLATTQVPSSTQATAISPKPETSVTPTKTQTVEVSKPKTLHTFNGSGTGKTEEFDVVSTVDVLLTYTGGPVSLLLMEGSNPPRQVYTGPSSTRGKHETNIPPPGRYVIGITCDKGCEWTITIRGTGKAVSSQTASKPTADSKGDTGNRDNTVNRPSVSVTNDSAIKTEKWDVFSQSKASIILSAPNTRAITLVYDPEARIATITGAKTSVPPKANVMVANLQLGNFVLVKADQDGKFQAEIDGHPGTHILIKQDTTGQIFIVEDPEATHNANTLRTIFPPGVLLRIPVEDSETGVSFSSAGRLSSDEDAPWTIEGNLAQTQLPPGQEVAISGQVAIRTRESNRPPNGQLSFGATLLVNSDGRQVGGGQGIHDITFYRNRLTHRQQRPVKGILLCGRRPTQLAFRRRSLG